MLPHLFLSSCFCLSPLLPQWMYHLSRKCFDLTAKSGKLYHVLEENAAVSDRVRREIQN